MSVIYDIAGTAFVVAEDAIMKSVRGPGYNYNFNKLNGLFQRWGDRHEDDPAFSPIGPEILDIEISVNGCPNACRFCYKNNRDVPPTNMSLATFKKIIDRMPRTLTQVAFGITGVKTNPDFLAMMRYCREIGIVPNFTLSGIDLDMEFARQAADVIGAVAVSAYQTDKNVCYDTVSWFSELGIRQTNIHLMVSEETIDFVYEVLNDRLTDPRLAKMNAIVFLGVKPKGRAATGFHPLSTAMYTQLVQHCLRLRIPFGFDSCSAPKFESSVRDMQLSEDDCRRMIECSESCESSLFSAYINVHGEYWHCSFAENESGQKMVSVLAAEDFLRDVWYSPMVCEFREKSLASSQNSCRRCTIFPGINP